MTGHHLRLTDWGHGKSGDPNRFEGQRARVIRSESCIRILAKLLREGSSGRS